MWWHERLKPKDWKGQACKFMDPKYDGFRVTFFKQDDNTLKVFGRTVEDHLEMSEKLNNWKWFFTIRDNLPKHSSLDGEVYFPTKPASYVSHAIAARVENLFFVPFAVPVLDGKDLSYMDIEHIDALIEQLGLKAPPRLKVPEDATVESLQADAARIGIEGYVLKEHHYDGWWKVKVVHTADCVVTGIQPGEGKYKGFCGALKLSVYKKPECCGLGHVLNAGDCWVCVKCNAHHARELVEVADCSGMTDMQRRAITKHDIGRVVEVAYQEMGSKGRLRHPRFVRWRDDKPRRECTSEQF